MRELALEQATPPTVEDARSQPFWHHPAFKAEPTDLRGLWEGIRLARIRDLLNPEDGYRVYDREAIREFLETTYRVEEGMIYYKARWVPMDRALNQWERLAECVPAPLLQAAAEHPDSKWSRYSPAALKMLRAMGWRGGGLGKNEQGDMEPVAVRRRTHRSSPSRIVAYVTEDNIVYGKILQNGSAMQVYKLSYKGTPLPTTEYIIPDIDAVMPVVRQGRAIVGVAESTFPHPAA